MILSEQFICYSFATRFAKDGSTKIQINVSDLFRNVQAVRKQKKFGEENKKEKLQAKENKMRNTNREMKNEKSTIDVLVGYKSNLSEWALHLTSK